MMIIPTGTDAPIYHWPYATVGMILLNVVLIFVVPPRFSSDDASLDDDGNVVASAEHHETLFERYALTLGNGLHPVQWVTHNFLHYGFEHLIGNLIFLWAFGIVVEGKLGVIKYLIAYLSIGTLHGVFTQVLLLWSGLSGHAAGASAIIFGLLAVCMVWAPRNELNCIVIWGFGLRMWVNHWDLRYTTVALLYIGLQVFNLIFWGTLSGRVGVSELGHLSGALWGTVVAVVLLKAGLVDCENWDIFSLWAKDRRLKKDWKDRGKRQEHEKAVLRSTVKAHAKAKKSSAGGYASVAGDGPTEEERAASAVRRVNGLIENGDVAGALNAYDRAARTHVNWPDQASLYGFIKALHAQGAEVDSLPLMRDHCRKYPADSARVSLKLAQILIRDRQRPAAALRVLNAIPAGTLPAELETARRKLSRQAERLCEEGVLEVEGDD